jgi:Ubiquitin carboxyl-terminal hydrolase
LHAVCIHDGGAEGGHYFIYIKDHNKNVWHKFNDMRVTVVEESEVFLNANGGHGQCTAFWVVYISSAEKTYANQFVMHSIDEASYANFIPPQITQDVFVANQMLLGEIADHKDTQICVQINEQYL